MLHVLNGKEMHSCDETTILSFKVPSLVLMEKAALQVVSYIKEHFDMALKIGVICGPGNNGADGIAIARLLFDANYDVKIYLCCDRNQFSKDEKSQYESAVAYQVPFASNLDDLKDANVVVDAIFGTGLSRNIEGNYKEVIDTVNEWNLKKIAVDIPSGISSDDGQVLGVALKCDVTISFAFYKVGQLLYPGKDYCGEVICKDIGISPRSFLDKKIGALAIEESDVSGLLPKRMADSHKGSFGKVLVIAGSKNMAGAAILAAKACYLTGAGLVRVYTDEANRIPIQTALPEAILTTYENRINEEELVEALNWPDLVLLGPGLSQNSLQEKIVKFVFDGSSVPMVVDADGLNIVAKNKMLLKRPHMELVLTPHLGEMSRLTNHPISYIKENSIPVVEEFSREYNVIVALKSAATISAIPYLQSYINTSGNPGMATAGSGDVLSGIIAGLMAQGLKGEIATPLAVYLHGMCGDMAKMKKGEMSVMASDILEEIPFILKEFVL